MAMWSLASGGSGLHIIERDDGMIDHDDGAVYLEPPNRSGPEGQALRLARGKVLDIGCGPGRHALYLQQRGLNVLGIDQSPLVIKAARKRGLRRARVLPIAQISPRLGRFDTVVMLGNNFGLFANPRRARGLLRRLSGMTAPDALLIAQSTDIYQTADPAHLAYHRRNRRRGRMSGQIRMRARYRQYRTPWFDYLMVSRPEMQAILTGTGWHVARFIDGQGPMYVAVIEKSTEARTAAPV